MAGKEIYRLDINVGITGDEEVKSTMSSMDKYTEKTEKRLKQLDKLKVNPSAKLDDKATSPSKKVEGSLKRLDRLKAISTADLMDKAAPKIKKVTRGVGILDKAKANPSANLKDKVSKASKKATRSMKILDKIRAGPVAKLKDLATSASEKAKGALTKLNKLRVGATLYLNDELSPKLQEISKKMKTVGTTMTKTVTAPIVGLGALSLKTVAGFDDSMAKVQSISGATGEDFDSLRSKAKELGRSTAHSASDAANGMTILAATGASTNDILSMTGDVLNLASASGLELDQSAGILTNTLGQFGLKAKDAGTVANQLVKAANSSKTSVEGMGEAMKYAGTSAANMNMDVAQTAAMLGIFANVGIEGSAAGTTFTSMANDLTKNSTDGAIAIGDMSVATYDAQGNMRDMGSIMADVESATKDMGDEQRNNALQAIFGQQAMKGVNAILTEGADKYRELEKEIRKSNNAAETAAAIQENTLGGAFRAVGSAIEGMMIEIGDVIKGPIQSVAKVIVNLANVFGNLSEPMKNVVVVIATVVAAIGPLLLVFSKIISVATTIGPVLAGAFGVITGPIGIAVGLIAGIAIALALAWKHSETFRSVVTNAFESVKSKIQELVPVVKDKLGQAFEFIKGVGENAISGIASFWQSHGSNIMNIVNAIATVLKVVLGLALEFVTASIKTFANIFTSSWENIKSIVVSVVNIIGTTISSLVDIISGVIDIVVGLFTGDFARAFEGLKDVFNGLGEFVATFFIELGSIFVNAIGVLGNTVAQLSLGIFDFVADVLGSVLTFLDEMFTSLFTSIVDKIIEFKNLFVESFMNIFTSTVEKIGEFKESFVNKFTEIKEGIIEKFQEIREGIMQAVETIKEVVMTGFEMIGTGIGNVLNGIKTIVQTVWNEIKNVISTAISAIQTVVSAGFNLIKTVVSTAVNVMKTVVTTAWNAIKSAATSVTNVVKSAWQSVTGVFDTVKSKVSSMAETIKGAWNTVKSTLSKPITGTVSFVKNKLGIGENYKGTSNWEGGLTHIHERGGEIIDLPSGTRIYPHDRSVAMAREEGMQQAQATSHASYTNIDNIKNTSISKESLISRKETSPYTLRQVPGSEDAPEINVVTPTNNKSETTVIIDGVEVNIDGVSTGDNGDVYEIVEEAQEKFGKELLEAIKNIK